MNTLKTVRLIIPVILMSSVCYAQIMITPQVPPVGLMQKKQLWNMLIVNNSGLPQQVQVQVSLTDRSSGQPLLNGTSRTLLLQKGATQLREDDFAPVHYNFSGLYSATDRNAGDLLMAGSYEICYALLASGQKAGYLVTEECLHADAEPLTPPQLISPSDTARLETIYPVFNWIPPSPLSMFSDLKYELLIVESQKGQNPNEAIQRNTPVYSQKFLNTPYLQYPSSYKPLEPGKHYAWQVVAKNGNEYTQKTEAWAFSIKDYSASIVIDAGAFTRMTRGFDAQSYVCHGNMRFEYNNESGDSTTILRIYNLQNNTKTLVESREIKLRQGQNFVSLKTGNRNTFKNMQVYLLEIINNRNERWDLKFKYVKKE